MRRCDPLSIRVSALLDAERRKQDRTQKALAASAALSAQAVSMALDGRTVRTSTVLKIADALGVDVLVGLRLKA